VSQAVYPPQQASDPVLLGLLALLEGLLQALLAQ
jgi:hypothetical protein